MFSSRCDEPARMPPPDPATYTRCAHRTALPSTCVDRASSPAKMSPLSSDWDRARDSTWCNWKRGPLLFQKSSIILILNILHFYIEVFLDIQVCSGIDARLLGRLPDRCRECALPSLDMALGRAPVPTPLRLQQEELDGGAARGGLAVDYKAGGVPPPPRASQISHFRKGKWLMLFDECEWNTRRQLIS